MVFSEKSVIGLVLGLSLATNMAGAFVPNRASPVSSGLASLADEEWFYEEKKTMYSDDSTERGKRVYNKRAGEPTTVFHDNYPLSPNKPKAQPSADLPYTISSDNRWYQNESTLSYDATMRQRIGPSKPKTMPSQRASASDEQGMRAPMPAANPNSTATTEMSPYQPAAYSTDTAETEPSTIPVANVVEPKQAAPVYKPVQLRPEDAVTTNGRWFNTESKVSYGSQALNRHWKTVKVELREELEGKTLSPFVPVSDTSNSTATAESSPYQPAAYSTEDSKTAAATIPVANTVEPKQAAPIYKPVQLSAQDTVTTNGKWFNTESKKSYGEQPMSRTHETIKVELREQLEENKPSPFLPVSDKTAAPSAKRSSMDITTTLPLKTSGDAKEMATQPEPTKKEETSEETAARLFTIAASTVTTEDRWFNTEKRDFLRPAQKHVPYSIRNPEYHMSPSTTRAVEEGRLPASAGAFVGVNYNPVVPTTSKPEGAAEPAAHATETPTSSSAAQSKPQVAAELIQFTSTTDQKWFNSESKGTHYSGVPDIRQHIPYTIRNPEYHRSPNMLRAEQEKAAASPSAGAFVSVGWNPAPEAPAAEATETKAEASTPAEPVPAESPRPIPNSATTTTDAKWFNTESKGTYESGVKDVRQHKPYQLIPKEDHEAERRTSSS